MSKLGGPKTRKGKIAAMFNLPLCKQPTKGTKSQLIHKMRNCAVCPLGAKERRIKVGSEYQTITEPAKCPQYKAGNPHCPIGVADYINRMRVYIQVIEKHGFDTARISKLLAMDKMSDLQLTRQVETILKGHPGGMSNLHDEGLRDWMRAIHEIEKGTVVNVKAEISIKDIMNNIIEAGANTKIVEVDADEAMGQSKKPIQKEATVQESSVAGDNRDGDADNIEDRIERNLRPKDEGLHNQDSSDNEEVPQTHDGVPQGGPEESGPSDDVQRSPESDDDAE